MSDHDPKGAGRFVASPLQREEAWTIRCVGDFDVEAVAKFEEAFAACLDAGASSIHADCSRVSFTDSSGLHALIRAAERARDAGIAIRFSLTPQAMEVADVAGVGDLLRAGFDD